MKLHTETLSLPVERSSASAYLARPAAAKDAKLPGIVVVQEVWGVDAHVRDLCERFATAGYVALAPALYSIGGLPAPLEEPRIDRVKAFLDGAPPAVWFDANARMEAASRLPQPDRDLVIESLSLLMPPERPWERYLNSVFAARNHLANGPANGRAIGVIGFCMGGLVAMRAACRDPDFAAAVSFYGLNPPDEPLESLKAPILSIHASEDPRINASIEPFEKRMQSAGKSYSKEILPQTRHAFFNDTRASYSVEAARTAWARTLSFFAEHLN